MCMHSAEATMSVQSHNVNSNVWFEDSKVLAARLHQDFKSLCHLVLVMHDIWMLPRYLAYTKV